MVRILRSALAVGLYCLVVIGLIQFFQLNQLLFMDTTVFSLLGVVLSIFLVFRTNTAYDRWWEARKQWGALVNNTRNLAIYVDAMWPAENMPIRRFMAKHISNFCFALVEHLRSGVQLKDLIYLTDAQRTAYEQKDHIPNYIAQQIFLEIAEAHRQGHINEGDYINIKAQHQSLLDILGACERIKKTPIPFSYSVYLKVFITAYALISPFALFPLFGWMTIPIVMFFLFALLGVELLGEEIEDPFGLDCNDLPTGDIAHTIKRNVFEILEDRSVGEIPKKELYEKYH